MMLLLDVNALLAMSYEEHIHHVRVDAWVSKVEGELGTDHVVLSTCPITELGFLRVGSGKAGHAPSVDAARADLRVLKSRWNMVFIPDDLHTHDLPAWVGKSPQTTDGYLLALAKSHGGYLATLDRFIPDAVLILEDAAEPIMVREEPAHAEWAIQVYGAADRSGSRGIATR